MLKSYTWSTYYMFLNTLHIHVACLEQMVWIQHPFETDVTISCFSAFYLKRVTISFIFFPNIEQPGGGKEISCGNRFLHVCSTGFAWRNVCIFQWKLRTKRWDHGILQCLYFIILHINRYINVIVWIGWNEKWHVMLMHPKLDVCISLSKSSRLVLNLCWRQQKSVTPFSRHFHRGSWFLANFKTLPTNVSLSGIDIISETLFWKFG